jgi:hypothetical protein
MGDGTTFHTVKLNFNIIGDLKKHMCFNSVTANLLQTALEHGGYIAGGFGTLIARHYLLDGFKDLEDGVFDGIRRHLGQPQPPDPERVFKNAGCGDIDVWFPNIRNLSAFMHDQRRTDFIARKQITVTPTLTNAALEHLIDGDARVQVITRWLQPLEDQIAAFDIYNGAVAVTENTITVPEHWEMLEKANMLHVSTWASPWTINRFLKWVDRKGYKNVTPSVAEHVMKEVFNALEWHAKWGDAPLQDEKIKELINRDRLKRRFIMQKSFHAQKLLAPLMSSLKSEQLLELSALFKEPLHYDFAMQEIHRRMPPK